MNVTSVVIGGMNLTSTVIGGYFVVCKNWFACVLASVSE